MGARNSPFAASALRAAVAALALLAASAFAAPIGEITHLSGTLVATRADGSSRVLAPKSTVETGETLTTAADTYARVKFRDGGEITLRPESQFRVETYQFDAAKPQGDNLVMTLVKGGLRAITGLLGKRRSESYQLRAGVATIGVRGTNYGAFLCQNDCGNVHDNSGKAPQNGLHVDVAEGTISVTNQGGTSLFSQGAFGFVPNALTLPVTVPSGQGLNLPAPPLGGRPGIPGATAAASSSGQICVVE